LRGRPGDAATAHQESATAAEEAAALGLAPPGDGHDKPPEVAAVCTRQGRLWRLDLGSRSVLVEHSVGMLHLAVLVANPGTEIPAVELVAGVAVLGNVTADTAGSAQPVLDQLAIGQYRRRLAELSADIDDLESRNDGERAAPARAERDWLIAELTGATGISGRSRRFPDNAERARITVGKAIRRALARISDTDAVIGTHLRTSVHTGMCCSYRPAVAIMKV
jgi:hypothetical protein